MPEFLNVREPWEIHDTLCVCENLFGSESNAGFFTTFNAFGAQNEHLFFKRRSEGNVHRAYNNQQSEDRSDFVFHCFAVGLAFFAPPTIPAENGGQEPPNAPANYAGYVNAFWTGEFPRHCNATLNIGQDCKLDLNGMMMSPGYGPQTSGVGNSTDDLPGGTSPMERVWAGCQGVPVASSRYWVALEDPEGKPKPIGIPKGEIFELRLKVAEYARDIFALSAGPFSYYFGSTAENFSYYPARYYIQASLWGYREVQQRGQLRAS